MRNREIRVAVTSKGISRRRFIDVQLDARIAVLSNSIQRRVPGDIAAIAGWGNKASGLRARQLADRSGLPCWLLEDGFLRSAGDGSDPQALSLVVDDLGIYYDARRPSRLQHLIASGCPPKERGRAQALIDAWRRLRLSKYNHARDGVPEARGYVLVVDQTAADASIEGAMASPDAFRRMLEAALDEYPGRKIILKIHPDVFAGRRSGHFQAMTQGAASRVEVLGQHLHAPDLIEPAEAVYTVSSQMGFEALIWGRRVRTFGMPFYAGWGLTSDSMAAPARRAPATIENLVFGALVAYTRYVDPETGRRCEVETVMAHLALQRQMRARFPETIHAIGFSRWKKPIARAFFSGSQLKFVRHPRRVPAATSGVAVWGSRPITADRVAANRLIRVEDGFIRSVGLGAALVRPSSWVADDLGMYYDPRSPSRLETMLSTVAFDRDLLERAARLRERIVAASLSKYNLKGDPWCRPATTRRVVLVAGQVEGDASLMCGGVDVTTNLGLLQAVRQLEQDSHIVYKPHPDVVAGLRPGAVPVHMSARLCDQVLDRHSVIDVIREVDAVHVMTSLTGFEALLHGKAVTVHGLPFYAGWGLTNDRYPMGRRSRRLSLDMLVAAALILYPTYVSEATGRFTTPERILSELEARRSAPGRPPGLPALAARAIQVLVQWRRRCMLVR